MNEWVELLWFLDGILLTLALLLGAGIVVYTRIQAELARQRLDTLRTITGPVWHLPTEPDSVIKATIRNIIDQLTFEQFVAVTKRRAQCIPAGLEEAWHEACQASEKVAQIEALARGPRHKWHRMAARVRGARYKWRRIEALVCLGVLNSPQGLDILEEGLYEPDENISYFAMLALSQIKNSLSAAILLRFLSRDPIRGQKIVSLLETFPPTIADELLTVTENPNAAVRFWAVKLLSKFALDSCFERVASLTDDASPDVRAAACECLGNLGRSAAEDVLLPRLHDRVWFVRMQAVRALFKVAGTKHRPELLDLLAHDDSPHVKTSVKDILLKDIDHIVAYLEQCLRHGDDMTKKYCVEALVDANYIPRMLADLLSDDVTANAKAALLLDALIKSRIYFGLKRTLDVYDSEPRKKILGVIREIDNELACQIGSF